MGKGSPKLPAAPDPAETAAQQTASNKELALWNSALNNVNQITPYGNISWSLGNATQGGNTGVAQSGQQSGSTGQPIGNFLVGQNGKVYDTSSSTWGRDFAQDIGQGSNISGVVNALKDNKNYESYGLKPFSGQSTQGTQNGSSGSGAGGFDINGTPQWTSTINLSEDQQAILDSEERRMIELGLLGEDQIGRIRDSVSNPYSYGGLTSTNDYATAAENALYQRLNPQFDRDEEALRTRLINQGIGQGSQAYQREMDTFNQMKNDARSQSVLAGQQYGITGRNQDIREYDAQRNAALNEYNALVSGTQVTNPSFSSGNQGGAAPVDYAGLVSQNYQNQIGQYNAQQAGSNNLTSSLFGLGGSFLGAAGKAGSIGALFSDIRLKRDITAIGTENGFPVYKFRYNQDHDYVRHVNLPDAEYIGVMAQDVENIMPEAVFEIEGFKRVNYGMIGVEMREVE
jgi:hypothetical protein